MKALFIGGPNDRLILDVDGSQRYIRAVERLAPTFQYHDQKAEFKTFEYHREIVHLGLDEFSLYVLAGMSMSDVLTRLIQSYAWADYTPEPR